MFQPKRTTIHSIPSFRLGLNNQQSSEEISDIEMADCENFSIENDSIVSAPGYVLWDDNATAHPGPYWGGIGWKNSAGNQVTIRQRKDVLEYSPDGGETWTLCTLPTTGSPAVAISLAQVLPTFAALNDILLYSNGTDSVLSTTDGITWVTRSALPKSKVVFNNGQNRIIFAAQPASPYRIDWSDINTPLTVTATAYQLIDPNSNGYIVGMGLTPDGTNVVFKELGAYSISSYLVDGAVDVNFIGHTNCANHHTICTTEDSIIWAGIPEVYELRGGIHRIDENIDPIIRNNVQRNDLFVGAYYNGKYHLSMPDSTVSLTYNSQEYIYYKYLSRGDSNQPYPITRNRRYFGCYIVEDFTTDAGRDITLYAGESRPSSGSPVTNYTNFGWINDFRDGAYTAGVAGVAQSSFVVTKYFTDNIPYYIKRFKKLFANVKVTQDVTLTLSYRFLPYGAFIDVSSTFTAGDLDFLFGDASTGGFSEGYSFSLESLGSAFIDIENSENPRGIQFKIATNSVDDIQIYSLAYNFIAKTKFRA